MYTRCTHCRTVFHITVAELRAADGQVVCGLCDEEFDALEHLADTLPPPEEAQPDQDSETSETPSDRDSDARDEEEFLKELESLIVDDGEDSGFPGPEDVFRLDDDAEDGGDAEGGERLVIAQSRDDAAEDDQDAADGVGMAPDEEQAPAPAQTDDTDEPPLEEPDQAGALSSEPPENSEAPEAELPLTESEPRGRKGLRIALVIAAVVVLGGIWAHSERGRLLRHPLGQAVLKPVYELFGLEAAPDWSPDALRVLRSATVADPGNPGSLRVTTEFRNTASFAQPYPTLRVTLDDRWGQEVSSRDFTPSQYRDDYVAGRLMGPGERVQATVSLPDPGARADGFRVDLCLEGPGRRLECATEATP